jgi:hypothetical protein
MPRSRGPRPQAPRLLDSREPPRVPLGLRVSARDDGRFRDVPRKDIRGNGDWPRRDFGEFVRLLVVPAGNVIELDAVELVYRCGK